MTSAPSRLTPSARLAGSRGRAGRRRPAGLPGRYPSTSRLAAWLVAVMVPPVASEVRAGRLIAHRLTARRITGSRRPGPRGHRRPGPRVGAADPAEGRAMAVDLRSRLSHVELPNPIMTASGCAGAGRELAQFMDVSRIGAFVTK